MMNRCDTSQYALLSTEMPRLSNRERFAAMAMQGLLANPSTDGMSGPQIVEEAVDIADQLIKALGA
jgi:hypothetical protein